MTPKPGVLGVYEYFDDFLTILGKLRREGKTIQEVYTPVPREEIADALGTRRSPVRFFTLFGGAFGIASGIALVIYASSQWMFIVGGKPPIPAVPTVIVAFEFCILFSVLFTIVGFLLFSGLPKITLPEDYDPRLSQDRFGVFVLCGETEREALASLLRDAGAEEVHDVH